MRLNRRKIFPLISFSRDFIDGKLTGYWPKAVWQVELPFSERWRRINEYPDRRWEEKYRTENGLWPEEKVRTR